MSSASPVINLDDLPLSRLAWFLDYDGSLCPHLEVWEERVYDPEEIHDVVSGLARRAGATFWNTGRRPESLGGVHPGFAAIPGYFIHGSLKWIPGTHGESGHSEFIGPRVPEDFRAQAQSFADANPGFRFEVKPTSLRFTPAPSGSRAQLDRALAPLDAATPEGWYWLYAHRGVELLARGYDKRTALRRELAARPDLVPIAIGDDTLDRPAIEEALQRGGFAVVVGDTCGWITEVPHQAHQLIYCDKPQDVLDFIREICA
jgi:trehalose-6-phosphatase